MLNINWQRFLPLPELSRQIEGDSVHRVEVIQQKIKNKSQLPAREY